MTKKTKKRRLFFYKNLNHFLRSHYEIFRTLKNTKKKIKLTQAQIAEKLDISQQPYASCERGVKKQPKKILLRLHKYWMLQLTI
jgi:DNA-binding helix-turn-helix protein